MDEPRTYAVPLRRRTDAERLDYFMHQVAVLSVEVRQLAARNEALRRRVNRLEKRLEEQAVTPVTES
jgi:cell division protein FtsB